MCILSQWDHIKMVVILQTNEDDCILTNFHRSWFLWVILKLSIGSGNGLVPNSRIANYHKLNMFSSSPSGYRNFWLHFCDLMASLKMAEEISLHLAALPVLISQTPLCTSPKPTMHHFVAEMCTCVHISVTKYCIVGYLCDALWDLWDGSIASTWRKIKVTKSRLF